MSENVLSYLQGKGLPLRSAGPNNVHLPCFFCAEDPQARGRLYINVDPSAEIPGLFKCHLCGEHGALPTIKKHFGDYTPEQEEADTTYKRRQILAEATDFYYQSLSEHVDALHWLKKDRGLSIDMITDRQLGYAAGGLYRHLSSKGFSTADILDTGLVKITDGKPRDFLQNAITIPYITAGSPVCIRGRSIDPNAHAKYLTPPGQKARLYNSDICWTDEEIFVTEGEFDSMVLTQNGFPAVAVPGSQAWQDSWDTYFDTSRRVWIVFDTDNAGKTGAVKIMGRLPKARMVSLPHLDGQKVDVTSWMVEEGHTSTEFAGLLQNTSGGLLVTVDQALEEHASLQGLTGIKLFAPDTPGRAWEDLFHPGFLPSQVSVFLAKSGTGKTILMLNLFQRACTLDPDLKILFFSLEQTRGDWWERARRIYRFFNLDATDQDAAAFWKERLMLVDRNRLTEDDFVRALDDFEYEMGKPSLAVVDYLGYYARGFKGEPYQRTGDAIMSLKAIGKERRIRVWTPHQVSRQTMYGSEPTVDSARDSGVVEETADFVFPIWSMDAQNNRPFEEHTGETYLKIGKSRHGGVGSKLELCFAPLSLALALATEGPLAQRARNEFVYRNVHKDDWETAQVKHRTSGKVARPLAAVKSVAKTHRALPPSPLLDAKARAAGD